MFLLQVNSNFIETLFCNELKSLRLSEVMYSSVQISHSVLNCTGYIDLRLMYHILFYSFSTTKYLILYSSSIQFYTLSKQFALKGFLEL